MKLFAFYVAIFAFLMTFLLGNVHGLKKCDDEPESEEVPCDAIEFMK